MGEPVIYAQLNLPQCQRVAVSRSEHTPKAGALSLRLKCLISGLTLTCLVLLTVTLWLGTKVVTHNVGNPREQLKMCLEEQQSLNMSLTQSQRSEVNVTEKLHLANEKMKCLEDAVYKEGEAARAGSKNGRIYVGNLPADVREKELEELFHRYGRIRSVELKNRGRCSSSPFAFIKFQDPRDAEDAVFGRNGYDFGSCRLRVEFPRPFRGSRGDGGGYGAPRGRNGPPSRRSNFRVLVSGLPPSGSWQDLKDHMRKAGDVCYADVHKDGMGIVEFIRKEDMEYALRKLDDTKFRSHEGENYYIRVCPERNASYSRSRSRSRGRDSTYQSRRSPSPFRPY
ncbi:serine/arginine-rich splicing factor 9-like [Discoglossus pictus]